jgi:nucleotide-binding universal stress UspA family protein
MNIASILCPTDFSEPSRHAMEHAAAIASWCGARVIPLHVQEPVYATVAAYVGAEGERTPAGTQIVYGTSPAEAIADFAASSNVDLIVMGTHGLGGFQHLILGSVTESVLREAECPVLTVPPRVRSTSRVPFKRLLCAVDFSASSLAALELASSLALEGAAHLDVLHVVDEPDEHALFVPRPYDVHHHSEIYTHHVTEHLDRVLTQSARERLNPQYQVVRGNAEEEILLTATERRADVIVMGVGRGRAPMFGSTVNHVVRNATCPVLTVRR